MSAYDLLSTPIKRYVYDKGWEELRPIQEAAISKIISTDFNYVLASKTASGKTEAAFLPILSIINNKQPGVKVLYISPLIALINDQFERIDQLCSYLELPVTKWHGEANRTDKKKLIDDPSGILLITPESIEAMLVNNPSYIERLFSGLEFVVIDEIHSFIGNERGVHLQSLLSRIEHVCSNKLRYIGLSATLGSYDGVKVFFGKPESTKVLLSKDSNNISSLFRYFESEGKELPTQLIEELYEYTKVARSLIFPNTRGRVEEVAVKLTKINQRNKGAVRYFSHHSSVDKEVREFVENFAKSNVRENFAIACTSTLELGIDIGSIDQVVQIDSTFSVASLIQRTGRSGRRIGKSNLLLFATNEWSLLQSIACFELYNEGFIEPLNNHPYPIDIALHQILSILKSSSGIKYTDLVNSITHNYGFSISELELEELIKAMVEIGFIEDLRVELILGQKAEALVNNKDFYSVFKTEDNFKVVFKDRVIGDLPLTPQLREDENIFLAAKIWKIIEIDERGKRIYVVPANDGKNPIFLGTGGQVHEEIRKKMLQIASGETIPEYLDEDSSMILHELQKQFNAFNIKDFQSERPLTQKGNQLEFYSFTSTKINRTLSLLFNIIGLKADYNEYSSSFVSNMGVGEFKSQIDKLLPIMHQLDSMFGKEFDANSHQYPVSKWGAYLPDLFKKKLLLETYFDVNGTMKYLEGLRIINTK